MKSIIVFVSLTIFSVTNISAQVWKQVWSDEFTGTAIERGNWKFETGGGGWGNNELQNYTSRPENAFLKNGLLMLVARKEPYQGMNYTSARMITRDLHSWKYGKVEARIKIPAGTGLWPAFWMLGTSLGKTSWPACGEIDIMEHVNSEPNVVGTIHWDNNGHVSYGKPTAFDITKFNTFSIEWDEKAIIWLVNGNKYLEANILNNINNTEEFHAPFFILLNLAVGGTWPGNPGAATIFPDTMMVDYVGVFQKEPTAVSKGAAGNTVISVDYNNSNEAVMINYTLQSNSHVVLDIYDILGRKVRSITAGSQQEGENVYTIGLQELHNNIYFIKGVIGTQPVMFKFFVTNNH